MNAIYLTSKGKEILTTSSLNGGPTYWVGYFGLAYVPNPSDFDADSTTLIKQAETSGENDESDSSEGELGDYIYNIWQGDLINEGHSIATGNFSKLTLYDRNLTSNFKYVYDKENDCNRLVTWTTDENAMGSSSSEMPSYARTGYRVYNGITLGDSNDSNDPVNDKFLPCPAPLFYAGSEASYDSTSLNTFIDNIGHDWPMCGEYPFVTPDMRFYTGTVSAPTGTGWTDSPSSATKFDTIPAEYTRTPCASADETAETLDQYAKYVSVSVFNKEHGHVSSEGYGVGIQESCHNMSTVTKLFPIARYEIESTGDPSTTDPNYSERGSVKSIKYNIRLNLREAYAGVQNYLSMLTYDEEGIFDGKVPNSFKFNRIGIYAIPVTIRHFYKEGDAANRSDCRATHYQVEISPDAKPELFAVMYVDEVCMSEDGSFGLNDYNTTFILNLENASDTNSSLCLNPEVYYNMVENEAITWYQNQLLATAGLSEAVTNLGVNMAHMMANMNRGQGTSCTCGASVTNVHNTYVTEKSGGDTPPQPVVSSGGIIIIQDDGVIFPKAGTDGTTGYRNVKYLSGRPESVDVPAENRQTRFSMLKDGKFTKYDNAFVMPMFEGVGYEQGRYLRPGTSSRIVWNTWYALIGYGKYVEDYPSRDDDLPTGIYFDSYSDDPDMYVYSITDSTLAGYSSIGGKINLSSGSSMPYNAVFDIIRIDGSTVYGHCDNSDFIPGTYHYSSAAIGQQSVSNVDLVVTENNEHVCTFYNPEKNLYISSDDLVDGLVYEIRINIRSIAASGIGDKGILPPEDTYGGMIAPAVNERPYAIYFYDSQNNTSQTYMWGSEGKPLDDQRTVNWIYPSFNRVPSEESQVAFAPGPTSGVTAPVLASAVVYFIKIDGKIYVMGY